MITTLNLRPVASLEDRHFAVRDFLVEAEAGRATRATLYLIDGTPATGGNDGPIWPHRDALNWPHPPCVFVVLLDHPGK